MSALDSDSRCPCGTGLTYGQCCGRYHAGENAPTAEALMRSRFTAFVTADEGYLLRTWDPLTRPAELDLTDSPIRFYRLDILDIVAGGPLDDIGVVEFEAFYKGGAVGSQRERSTFQRGSDGAWRYGTGEVS
ncbi:YchJ family protein [Corynebacterium guangdongense]|uniref:SEC-C motif-containing protein n=1 Tax=Corynebacterium guangdongense TaxID=1783348 RepID=A0ABU1ZWI0_9CORY|nr:YchJ family metal-binding protein [Corynebacterium guangdongense]MDR7329297.1 SEC-C motif-containing protein [Corynebacterium guangdongense]WJZ17863.1 hypothetical protein CGUA_06465 [Corynebacterium guangdongense]